MNKELINSCKQLLYVIDDIFCGANPPDNSGWHQIDVHKDEMKDLNDIRDKLKKLLLDIKNN